ncbi:MAG: tetratricopeptide repeat protein [Kiritimatiellia bacterium]
MKKIFWTSLLAVFACVAASPGQGRFSMGGLAVDTLEAEDPFAEATTVQLNKGGAQGDTLYSESAPVEPTGYFAAELPRDAADYQKYRAAEASARESAAAYRDVIASARQSIARGDWSAARRDIESALQDSPDSPYLLKKAALLYSLGGEYETADRYFSRYLQLKPDDVDCVAAWAAVANLQRDWPKAESLLNRAFELAPRNLSAHFQTVVFLKASSLNKPFRPYDWDHLTLAEMQIVANWMEADRQAYEELLGEPGFDALIKETLGPVNTAKLNEVRMASQRAVAARKRGQWQVLRDILMRLQDLGVKSYWVPLGLARALYELGNEEEALAVLTRVQQEHSGVSDAWQNSAFIRIKAGDYEKGLADAREALQLSPNSPEIEFTVICALAGARKMDELWPLLEQWARKYPRLFNTATQGDDPFLQIIRSDSRFGDLQRTIR